MDMMDYLRQYGGQVKNRVMNPGQTLATALQEGMPTEQNPLGMFGFGGIVKTPKVVNEVRDAFIANRANDLAQVTLPDKTPLFKMKDGSWANGEGKTVFEDTQHMYDSLRDLRIFTEQQKNAILPDVMSSKRPASPFYKNPFPMEVPK